MMRASSLAAMAAAVAALSFSPARALDHDPLYPTNTPLRVLDKKIVDSRNRTVILRGVNVNQLGDYFQANDEIPSTLPFSRADFERIAALGANVVRLIVHWSLLEPSPGVHDEAYLDTIREAVGWAGELGMYVVLDMHQDAWGQHIATDPDETCAAPLMQPAIGWDGAPEWATMTKGAPRCMLAVRELSAAVGVAWDAFWRDQGGIQTRFVETWAWLAEAFKHEPTVAGYDLVNEPHWGLRYFHTLLIDKPRFYRRTLEALRGAEEGGIRKIVFFEPLALYSALPFEPVIPWKADKQIVYAPHVYLGSISMDVVLTGEEIIPLAFGFWQARREARRRNTTFWIGEWGWFGEGGEYAARFAALEDFFQVGSAFWQWKQACGDPHGMTWPEGGAPDESGNLVRVRCHDPEQPAGVEIGLHTEHALVLSRPRPRRFPGVAVFESDPFTQTLTMEGSCELPSANVELWVPGAGSLEIEREGLLLRNNRHVPGGWIVELEPIASRWSVEVVGEPSPEID